MVKLSNLFNKNRWADGAVMYQIYPRSFQDSNGDGIGDIPGIIGRLDYLKDLGVTGVWLSPFYPSPMADFGYDVADYCDVDPMFGTLADFKRLLKEAHRRDIKIMVDIVPNHTSDEHPWFKASKASRKGRYSDWYIWRDAVGYKKDGTPIPPNNWLDMFYGTSAWEWVPERKQFYLHSFHIKQPDLNWDNPRVHTAMKNVLRFWLKLGVDGFRVDAVPFLDKDPALTDNPDNPHWKPDHDPVWRYDRANSQGWPRHYTYLGELAQVLREPRFLRRPRFMVTEGYVAREDAIHNYLRYCQAMDSRVASPFIFEGIERPWSAVNWRAFLRDFHTALEGHNPQAIAAYAFGNHDQSRLASRLGAERARSVAVLQLTLPGMTFVYNGEELGMHDVVIPPEKIQDPGAVGGGGRDPERTPMQWSTELHSGFTTGSPWLPLAHDYHSHNVATEMPDPTSFYNLYKKLIHLRTSHKAFTHGSFQLIPHTNPEVLAFERRHGSEHYTVVMNFEDARNDFRSERPGDVIISSIGVDGGHERTSHDPVRLRPHEAVVIRHS